MHATPDGYLVTLEPGDHPFVRARVEALFRYPDAEPSNDWTDPREAKRSGDSEFHACVLPGGRVICLYAPDAGS